MASSYSDAHHRLMGQYAKPIRLPPPAKPKQTIDDLPRPLTSLSIIRMVASNHMIGVKELTGGSRRVKIVIARDEAIRLIYENTNLSFVRIGQRLHRNHATVIYSLAKQGIHPGTPIMRKRFAERAAA